MQVTKGKSLSHLLLVAGKKENLNSSMKRRASLFGEAFNAENEKEDEIVSDEIYIPTLRERIEDYCENASLFIFHRDLRIR